MLNRTLMRGSRARRRRRRGCMPGCLSGCFNRAVLFTIVVLGGLFALYQLLTWPDVERLASENPESTAFIDRWQEEHGAEARHSWVPYSEISPHLKRAVLVGEDIGFFSHQGFATEEIEAALEDAWEEKRLPRGASTITQQLAKNLWLSPSRSPLRKGKEAVLAKELEEELSKRRILELYLNSVQLGPGIFGAEAAAREYFGTGAANLGERAAAQLAAGLPNPDDWHPGSEDPEYRNRVELLLGRMNEAHHLWDEI